MGSSRTLGVIGGIAPPSTVDYYRALIAEYRERRNDGSYPSVVINSIDLKLLLDLIAEGRLAELVAYLLAEVERLARAGADLGLLASNTPHLVFDELARVSPIPLLSIVEAAAEEARRLGFRTVAVIGTRFTMSGGFYPDVFGRYGIAVLRPSAADAAYVHEKYVTELIPERYLAETRRGVEAVIQRLGAAGADGVVLAGTELPLLLRDGPAGDVPLLDASRIHVRRAIDELLR
jgi:aspartate racemase